MLPTLSIVIPCYNEEEVLPVTAKQFKQELELLITKELINESSFILFVNDGSSDSTWDILVELSSHNACYQACSLSRNRGHQNALLAGLAEARHYCDIAISIDCDGQDDISVIESMVQAYSDGYEIVYGVRSSRQTDSFFKRFSAQAFYRLLESMGVECIYNHADYRLMSKRAISALLEFKEVNLFLRGMVPLIGYKSTSVLYERHERIAGESHYPLSKMMALALNGITSLSVKPIRLISGIGLGVALISLLGIAWALITTILGNTVPGWASTTAVVCFMGGVQMLSIGILGEYIGKIYLETKHRPRFLIAERTWEMPKNAPAFQQHQDSHNDLAATQEL